MKEGFLKKLIVVAVVLLMIVPIIYEMVIGSTLKTIKFGQLDDKIEETQSYYGFGFSMVYVAPSSEKSTKNKKQEIKTGTADVKSPVTNETVDIVYLDYDKLSDEERKDIFGDKTEKTAYIFYVNGEELTTLYGEMSLDDLKTYISSYSGEDMSPNLVGYKVVENSSEFKKLINRKNDVTMAVFGTASCFYCNQFKAVYNQVASEKEVDIYYFDTSSYDADEMKKIKASGLKIPKACTSTQQDEDFETYDYDTPLTLFIKNGKAIDCISGYISKSELVEKLKSDNIAMIEEEKQEDTDKKDN